MKRNHSLWIIVTFLSIVALVAAGCTGNETGNEPQEPVEQEPEAVEPTESIDEETTENLVAFQQAPMLDDRDLPSVEERLPAEPKLSNEMPANQLDLKIGTYGGTIRTVTMSIDMDADIFVMSNEPLINTPGILGEEFTPNVLKDFQVTDDQQTFTFYMREGLKWSDGEPVTSEDVRFAIEDVLFNQELTPIFPSWLSSGGTSEGEPVVFEVIDEYTFSFTFDQPYGGLIHRMAIQGWRGYNDLLKPSHHLKPYHVEYTPLEELEPQIEERGFEAGEWYNLFNSVDVKNNELTLNKAIGFPALYPWIIVEQSDTLSIFERNPYYFKVDAAGNQLPYVDRLESHLVQDLEMADMKNIAGEVDFNRSLVQITSMALYREYEQNGYRALLSPNHGTNNLHLNLNYADDVWQEVVHDIRFRQALNLGINIEEIIEAAHYGFAEPSILLENRFDVDEANRLLDEMGMERGREGFRVGPDGNRFSLPIEIFTGFEEYAELLVEYFRDLHLDASMRVIDMALWSTRRDANELKITIFWDHSPLWYYNDWGQNVWAPLWNRWYTTGGTEGEEPPEEIKKFYRGLDQVITSSPEEGRAAIEDVRRDVGEYIWYINLVGSAYTPLIVNEQLGNVPEEGYAIAINFSAEQMFYKE